MEPRPDPDPTTERISQLLEEMAVLKAGLEIRMGRLIETMGEAKNRMVKLNAARWWHKSKSSE